MHKEAMDVCPLMRIAAPRPLGMLTAPLCVIYQLGRTPQIALDSHLGQTVDGLQSAGMRLARLVVERVGGNLPSRRVEHVAGVDGIEHALVALTFPHALAVLLLLAVDDSERDLHLPEPSVDNERVIGNICGGFEVCGVARRVHFDGKQVLEEFVDRGRCVMILALSDDFVAFELLDNLSRALGDPWELRRRPFLGWILGDQDDGPPAPRQKHVLRYLAAHIELLKRIMALRALASRTRSSPPWAILYTRLASCTWMF